MNNKSMHNVHILTNKDLQDVKEIVSGYYFNSSYVSFLKIKYNTWWKLTKTLKFYDFDEANRIIKAVTNNIKQKEENNQDK